MPEQNIAKPWWQSRSIWGGLVAVLAGVAGLLGYSLSEADQAQLTELIFAIVSAAGGLVAIYGRAVARRSIQRAKDLEGLKLLPLLLILTMAAPLLCSCANGMTARETAATYTVESQEVLSSLHGQYETIYAQADSERQSWMRTNVAPILNSALSIDEALHRAMIAWHRAGNATAEAEPPSIAELKGELTDLVIELALRIDELTKGESHE